MYVTPQTTQSIWSLWPKSFVFNADSSTTFSVSFQAKFLFMVRDGRATVHSIISRKVTITGFDLTSYRQCMQKWNHAIEVMHDQCKEIGKERCMMVSVVWSGLVGQCSFRLFSISAVQHSNVLHEIANDSDIRNRYGRKEKFHFKISK